MRNIGVGDALDGSCFLFARFYAGGASDAVGSTSAPSLQTCQLFFSVRSRGSCQLSDLRVSVQVYKPDDADVGPCRGKEQNGGAVLQEGTVSRT